MVSYYREKPYTDEERMVVKFGGGGGGLGVVYSWTD